MAYSDDNNGYLSFGTSGTADPAASIISALDQGQMVGVVNGSPGMGVPNPYATGPGPITMTPNGPVQNTPGAASYGTMAGPQMSAPPPPGAIPGLAALSNQGVFSPGGPGHNQNQAPNGRWGEMQGFLAAQEEKRAQRQDMREEGKFGMTKEAFGWKREEHDKEKAIQGGMVQAAQAGGYEGVIAFLEKNDPERALKFTDMKTDLDTKIMGNSVLRDIKIPQMKQEALMESYGVLGKMGYALLNAPPQERQKIYDNLLPIARKVNPEMPSNLLEAVPVFQLAIAQATPANQLFKYGQQSIESQSRYGKLDADYRSRLKAGIPSNDPVMVGLKSQMEAMDNKSKAAQLALTKTQIGMTNQIQDQEVKMGAATQIVSKNLRQASKAATEWFPGYIKASSALEVLKTEPNNTAAQTSLGVGFLRSTGQSSNLSDAEQEQKYSADGFPKLFKKIQSMAGGTRVELNEQEIKYINSMVDSSAQQMLKAQEGLEANWQDSTNKSYAGQIDWENVIKPSQEFKNYIYGQDLTNAVKGGNIPAPWLIQAKEAIMNGADPQAVQQRLKEKGMQLIQQQQQNAPKFTPDMYAPTPDARNMSNLGTFDTESNDESIDE